MPNYELQIIETGDGSHTLQIVNTNETYHSVFGAITEAQHVFIKNGLHKLPSSNNTIHILETGFGTGLNALLTLNEANSKLQKINYVALEIYPVPVNIIQKLNYTEVNKMEHLQNDFIQMHNCEFKEEVHFVNCFSFKKLRESTTTFYSKNRFNLIYFDAFAPDFDNEIWTEQVLKNMYDSLATNGILVSYCAKGVFKRTLLKTGFTIQNVAGPPGKREITIATKY